MEDKYEVLAWAIFKHNEIVNLYQAFADHMTDELRQVIDNDLDYASKIICFLTPDAEPFSGFSEREKAVIKTLAYALNENSFQVRIAIENALFHLLGEFDEEQLLNEIHDLICKKRYQ